MPIVVRLAFLNLFRHKWRTFATVLGVSLGIAAVLSTLTIGDNVRANVRDALEAAAGSADLLVTPGAQGRAVYNEADTLSILNNHPSIATIMPVLNYRAEPELELHERRDTLVPGITSGFLLTGRDTSRPEALHTEVVEGALPLAGSFGIGLAEDYARTKNIALGDELSFATQFGLITFTVSAILDDGVGIASTNATRVGVVALADLQEAVRLTGRVSLQELDLADAQDLNSAREALSDALGEAYTVTLPANSGEVSTGVVDTIQAGLQVLAATLIALGGFMAYNTFAASVVERTREYALLRTICMTRAQVQRLAVLEAAFISVLGVALGLILGIFFSYGITRVNALSLGFDVRTVVFPFMSVLLASVVGVVISLFAGLLPARAASRTPPVVAVQNAQLDAPRSYIIAGFLTLVLGVVSALYPWSGLWALLGSAMSMAALFVGISLVSPVLLRPVVAFFKPLLTRVFGVPGKLGSDMALRNASRNGVAIGIVIVGVGLIVGVGAMIEGINKAVSDWVDTSVVGDMFITTPTGFPEDFPAKVRSALPEVDMISGLAVRVVRFESDTLERGRSVSLILVDPERFNPESKLGSFNYIQGQGDNQSGYEALKEGKVLAANTMFDRFGVSRGDSVRLRTIDGFQDFEVAGVVIDFTGGGETFLGNLNEIERFGGGTPDLYVLTVQEGINAADTRDALREAFPELYLDISLNQGYRERIITLTRRIFTTTNALLLLAIVIASLGVANTLGMNLSQRQHEIAVLRTLGLTRTNVTRMIVSEGLIIIITGTLLGLLCGTLLAHVITSGANAITGYRIEPYYPLSLMLIALISSPIIGLIASYLPARRAARLSPVNALAGENS